MKTKLLKKENGTKHDIYLIRFEHSKSPLTWTWAVKTVDAQFTNIYEYGLFSEAMAQFDIIAKGGEK